MFRKRAVEVLGIDISASGVKLVGLGGSSERPVLEQCAIESLRVGTVVDGVIENPDDVSAALQRLIKQSGAKTKNVSVALPSSAVITKRLPIPQGLGDQEMEDHVEVEAKQYIPFPLEDVSLDFVEVGPSSESSSSVEVLIAAARRERVEALRELLEAVGLKPVIVDVSTYALHRSLARVIDVQGKSSPGTLSVLFKLGATASTMQVLRGKDLVYEREQSVGGAQLTQRISSYYGLSFAEAEVKKCQGSLAHDYEASVLIPYIDGMVQEMGRSLQFFFNSTQYNKVNQVFLAGGSALLPGLALAVAGHVQVPCSVVNPFEGMALGSSVKRSEALQEAPSYLRACGLALRRFFN
jgi:type IV pilus assembly protein PilM